MKELIEHYVSIWNRNGASELEEVFTEDSKYWDSVQSGNAIEVLSGAVAGTYESFPDVKFEITQLTVNPDGQLFLEWKMTGTNTGEFFGNPPTGRSVEIKGLDAISVEGNKIREIRSFYDTGLFNQQLGLQ
ncbi:MAG: ester cyclase [bacterium]|nr:ester cyclase [bacterium]